MLDAKEIIKLASEFPSKINSKFINWFTNSSDSIDNKSKQIAYTLFDSSLLKTLKLELQKDYSKFIYAYLVGYMILLEK